MENLAPLALLACPIGMGLMMWFMSRGMRGERRDATGPQSVEELRAEQARLASQIDRLEHAQDGAKPDQYAETR
jgi:hypothetical protein